MDATATKVCRDCRAEKPLDAFPLQKGGRHGRHPLCKPCRAAQERRRYERDREAILERRRNDDSWRRRARWRALERKYGLTRHDYEAIFVAQRGCCAICELRPARLHVDHCHVTGTVRGLLCVNCNLAVGELDDDPELCVSAAAYLVATSGRPRAVHQ
ncbi:MAG: endonuclease VII domain-containing protein [Acidimicrobiales bacterium]